MSFSKARYSAAVSAMRGVLMRSTAGSLARLREYDGAVDRAGAAELVYEVLALLKGDADGGEDDGEALVRAEDARAWRAI